MRLLAHLIAPQSAKGRNRDMSDGNIDLAAEARAQAYALPLDQLNPGDPALFRTDAHWPILERLRNRRAEAARDGGARGGRHPLR